MAEILHITNGDCAAQLVQKTGLEGTVLAWRDMLYDGVRAAGWPQSSTLGLRAEFLRDFTGGAQSYEEVFSDLEHTYQRLDHALGQNLNVVLWFDACLYDQAVMTHLLSCLAGRDYTNVELIQIASWPGVNPFHGLSQLTTKQLISCYPQRRAVSAEQFAYAVEVDRAFALQQVAMFRQLIERDVAPLQHVPGVLERWLQEQPQTGQQFGRLECLIIEAVGCGCHSPGQIFSMVAGQDKPPQFWGDATLWSKINDLTRRSPAILRIDGPTSLLPVLGDPQQLKQYHVALP